MKPIIEVSHLSKKYAFGKNQPHRLLSDTITDFLESPFKFKNRLKKDEFWALKNISFKINRGETIGVIGPNGAGKSTLLKILSRITPPTKGEVILRGKTTSLLEIGTGFHSELTGRENIYLNGAILGMKRDEIKRRFDEIVNFSGIEKFLETPIKHYSSGMYLRLGFSVAAHLDSDILLVDEVLAVGDTEFQKKCLKKIKEEVSNNGKTVLFVSHDLKNVQSLCPHSILLKNGKIIYIGETKTTMRKYHEKEK